VDAWHDCNESMLMTCRLEGEAASRRPQTRRLVLEIRSMYDVKARHRGTYGMPSPVKSSAPLLISTLFYAFTSSCLISQRGKIASREIEKNLDQSS